MTVTFRPAVRVDTPLIIGLAGPSKSGKSYSALRLATGLAGGKPIFMINTEGPRGHSYAEKFSYFAADLNDTFPATKYTEALKVAAKEKPGVVIIDSATHMHDGPGGTLAWHEAVLDRMAGQDYQKRQRATFTAWVEPKQALTDFIYQMLSMQCPVIVCMRAKEKMKIVRGKEPEPLGWQPIIGEELSFETLFTLTLPPFSKGAPDLFISSMREPFDSIVRDNEPIDEDLGRRLAEWARGGAKAPAATTRLPTSAPTEAPTARESGGNTVSEPAAAPNTHGNEGGQQPATDKEIGKWRKWLADNGFTEAQALRFPVPPWEALEGHTTAEFIDLSGSLMATKPQESLL